MTVTGTQDKDQTLGEALKEGKLSRREIEKLYAPSSMLVIFQVATAVLLGTAIGMWSQDLRIGICVCAGITCNRIADQMMSMRRDIDQHFK